MSIDNEYIDIKGDYIPKNTWRWLGVNESNIRLKNNIKSNCNIECSNITNSNYDFKLENIMTKGILGEEYDLWIKENQESPYFIEFKQKDNNDISNLRIYLRDKEDYIGNIIIYVDDECRGSLCIDIESDKSGVGTIGLKIQVYMGKHSKLNIDEVQIAGDCYEFINDISVKQNEKSELILQRINFGSKRSILCFKDDLLGENSSVNSNIIYLGKDDQIIDINDIVLHHGKNTKCDLDVKGTLMGRSSKTYKGTINLIKGCNGSKGHEMENVLILSDDIINKTVPIILCSEEDVEGNHGATIGKVDKDIINYLETRGIDEKDAKFMIIYGMMNKVIKAIPDNMIVEKIEDYMRETVNNE